jgi:hypothetical protein
MLPHNGYCMSRFVGQLPSLMYSMVMPLNTNSRFLKADWPIQSQLSWGPGIGRLLRLGLHVLHRIYRTIRYLLDTRE